MSAKRGAEEVAPASSGSSSSSVPGNKRARAEGDDAPPEVELCKGVSYTWTPVASNGTTSITFSSSGTGVSLYDLDWKSIEGYVSLGSRGGPPLFMRKINDGFTHRGDISYCGGGGKSTYRTSFKMEENATLEHGVLGPALDDDGAVAAENRRRATSNVPLAFGAFLDAGGSKAFDIVVMGTDTTNKATCELGLVTPLP